jgi:Ca2+-binding RTX toxin-like protein
MVRTSLLLAFALLFGLFPAGAEAADVSVSGATLLFAAAPNEANVLAVSLAAGTYTLTDTGAAVTAGAGCTQVAPGQVTCPSAGLTALSIDVRDLDDSVAIGAGTVAATLTGGAGDDVLTGGGAVDTLNGGPDSDRLDGGAANDVLDGGTGDDALDGGAGNDTYLFSWGSGKDTISSYDSAAGKVDAIQMGAGILPGWVTVSRDGTALVLKLTGTADELRVTSYFHADGAGGYQVEQVKFADGTIWDVAAIKTKVLAATAENDVRTGYATADVLSGLGGEDTLYGAAGNDKLDGGADNDTLYGDDGDDTVDGGAHADYLAGGNGNDLYLVDNGGDRAIEYTGGGNDTVQSTVTFTLEANVETLLLAGSGAINGTGNAQANTITGNAASNIITGGGGADLLNGGAGNDLFDFNAVAESGVTAGTWDVIGDFVRGADKIDLATLDANTATAANDAFTGFIASAAAFTQAGQLRFADGVLYGNTNADAAAEFAIRLTGIAVLDATDMLM